MISTSIKETRKRLHIGRLRSSASRWPWQIRHQVAILDDQRLKGKPYGWHTPGMMGRFGGGWQWCLCIEVGKSSINLNILFGIVSINWFKEQQS